MYFKYVFQLLVFQLLHNTARYGMCDIEVLRRIPAVKGERGALESM